MQLVPALHRQALAHANDGNRTCPTRRAFSRRFDWSLVARLAWESRVSPSSTPTLTLNRYFGLLRGFVDESGEHDLVDARNEVDGDGIEDDVDGRGGSHQEDDAHAEYHQLHRQVGQRDREQQDAMPNGVSRTRYCCSPCSSLLRCVAWKAICIPWKAVNCEKHAAPNVYTAAADRRGVEQGDTTAHQGVDDVADEARLQEESEHKPMAQRAT